MKAKRGLLYFLSCLIGLTVLVSCDDDDDDINNNNNQLTAAEFMTRAAGSDTFEISSGMMAQSKAANAGVKTYADTLIHDHTMTSMELKTLARQKNINLPNTMPADKQNLLNDLNGRNGADFDRRFADVQIQVHNEAIALFQRAINEVDDAQVKDFANRNLPHLQMHLARANQLKSKL
jgi:putative membrane protein